MLQRRSLLDHKEFKICKNCKSGSARFEDLYNKKYSIRYNIYLEEA